MIEKLEPQSGVIAKINELVDHINDLENKLLSAEERLDIKEANEALKRGKFSNFADLKETFEKLFKK